MSFKKSLLLFLSLIASSALLAAPGVVVLSGGGPEGDIGVTSDWSYPLYKKLIDNGDTTGDKKIKVVVLSLEKPDSNFMVDYLKSMGADTSENLVVSSKKDANDPKVENALKDADVIFIRGGNQGKAYQLWKGTKVQEQIHALSSRGGAIGGTSSGAIPTAVAVVAATCETGSGQSDGGGTTISKDNVPSTPSGNHRGDPGRPHYG